MVTTNDILSNLDTVRAQVTAFGDQDAGLAAENAQLRTDNAQLKVDLATANQKIADLQAQLAATTKTLWGASVWTFQGETFAQALARTEKAFGKLGIVRYYCQAPKWPVDQTGDRPLAISFKWLPAEVLAGKHDAEFKSWCAAAPDRVTYWTYWHEPEDEVYKKKIFTAADYRAAWQRLAGIAKASGKNLRATLILMAYTLAPNNGRNWKDLYPGDVVDVLAWDGYNKLNGGTPEAVYGPCLSVSKQAGKPWAIAETGVTADYAPSDRYAMLTQMSAWLSKADPKPEYVTYFDSDPAGTKRWMVSLDPKAGQAWTAGIKA